MTPSWLRFASLSTVLQIRFTSTHRECCIIPCILVLLIVAPSGSGLANDAKTPQVELEVIHDAPGFECSLVEYTPFSFAGQIACVEFPPDCYGPDFDGNSLAALDDLPMDGCTWLFAADNALWDAGTLDFSTAHVEPNLSTARDAGGPYVGKIDKQIIFDGGSSSDPDGQVVPYEWRLLCRILDC